MSLHRRLAGVFSATALGTVVNIFVQLINVPLMLRYWGAHLYGEWLLISAIPAYLTLTDLGFANAAGNDMTMRVHSGDKEGAIETFQSITALVLCVSLVIFLGVAVLMFFVPIHRLLHLSSMSPFEAQAALFLLCVNCLIILQWSGISAAYRCAGQYAFLVLSLNIIRFLEGTSVLVLLVWHARPVQLALLMLSISVVCTSWLLFIKRRRSPWLPFGVKHARWNRVRALWRPAAAFTAFPAGFMVNLQGMTMVIGLTLGPLAVAVFNPMRTLSRPAFIFSDAVKNSFLPELSAAFGQQNFGLARKLHRTACQVSVWLALCISAVLAVFGPRLFSLWTHGRLVMDVPTFYMLLGVVLVSSLWNASSSVPFSSNQHLQLAVLYLVCTSASLLVAYLLMPAFGLRGAAAALFVSEIAMTIYVLRLSNRLLSDHLSNFAASLVDMGHFKTIMVKLLRDVA